MIGTNTTTNEEFRYDAQGRLLEHWIIGTTVHDELGGVLSPDYQEDEAGTWSVDQGYLRKAQADHDARILRENVPTDLETLTVSYRPMQDVEDLDGDPETENEYGPEYYAQIMLKVTELDPVPPAEDGEFEYVALVITPNEVSLREWKGDEVTLLDSAEVESEKDVWYDLLIAWDEDTITVRRGLRGGEGAEILSAETTLESESTQMGFGLGAKADYLFDDVRLSSPSLSAEEPSKLTEYVYDALGRRVAMTDYVGASAYTTRYLYPPAADAASSRSWTGTITSRRAMSTASMATRS